MLIQAFGTSNTFGNCGEDNLISLDSTWPYILASKANVSVENLSCIAITNPELGVMLDYYIKPNSIVIAELNHPTRPRAGVSFDGLASPDNIIRLHDKLDKRDLVTREAYEKGGLPLENNNLPSHFVPISPPKDVTKRIVKHMEDQQLKEFANDANLLAKSLSKHWIFSTSYVVDQFALVCMMKAICHKHNSTFMFYGWHGDFRSCILPGWATIIEQLVPQNLLTGVKKSYFKDYNKEAWEKETCSDGHQNEVIHKYVAEKIYEETMGIWN